jgi:hypothetical protein
MAIELHMETKNKAPTPVFSSHKKPEFVIAVETGDVVMMEKMLAEHPERPTGLIKEILCF